MWEQTALCIELVGWLGKPGYHSEFAKNKTDDAIRGFENHQQALFYWFDSTCEQVGSVESRSDGTDSFDQFEQVDLNQPIDLIEHEH